MGRPEARKQLTCRFNGKLCVVVSTRRSEDAACMRAELQVDGRKLPAEVFALPEDSARSTRFMVLTPFPSARAARIVLHGERGAYEPLAIDLLRAKVASIANYRLRGSRVSELRDIDATLHPHRTQARLLRFLEGESGKAIWRMDVTMPRSACDGAADVAFDASDASPHVRVFDGMGDPMEFELYPFENQDLNVDGISAKRFIFSLEIPYDANYFYVLAGSDPSALDADASLDPSTQAFCSCDGRFYEGKRAQTRDFMKDACADPKAYMRWLGQHRATSDELVVQTATVFESNPKFSIVVPCFESQERFLKDCISSVVAQSYENWELILIDASPETRVVEKCVVDFAEARIRYVAKRGDTDIVSNTNYGIEHATGDWVAFLDHDDVLEPDALFSYAQRIDADGGIDALFCDEDVFERLGEFKMPVFKSTLNLDLLYSYNCVTHFLAVRREALDDIGLSKPEVSGAQDYDLTLRLVAAGRRLDHVPRMLYHWRIHPGSTNSDNLESKPYAQEAGRLALQRHFEDRKLAAEVMETSHPFVYRVRYALPEPAPFVSIVIPNKDHVEELDTCVRSIFEGSTYDDFEIVIVENNSELARTFDYYDELVAEHRNVKVVTWVGAFNYSQIVNFGASHAQGCRLLFLNNDTKLISPDFIQEMLGFLERDEVGVVGAKLFFRDGLVQHAGIEVGPFDGIVHVNQDFTDQREGYRGKATRTGDFSAVTGACQMVRRDVFDEVGGYDSAFAVGFNDADFCLRARQAGYLTVFTPYAKLYHYEFTSRGREEVDAVKRERWGRERDLFHERWAEIFADGDPYSNPNLSLESSYYAL